MRLRRLPKSSSGLTLLELVIALAVLMMVAALGIPALLQFVHRGKIEGFTRNSAMMLREARLEAVKGGFPCIVWADSGEGSLVAFADLNRDGIFNPDGSEVDFRSTDYPLRRLPLPEGVSFDAPDSQPSVEGFTTIAGLPARYAVFSEDGSINDAGAFRVGDERGNFLEIRVAPAATAKITIRKWDEDGWYLHGENERTWTWL